MGGGKSSGGGGQVAPPAIRPAPQAQLQTTGYGGMGPTPVPQTFTPQAMPPWMRQGAQMQQPGVRPGQQQNWFSAPWWGTDAANPGRALGQEDLMYQQPQTPPQGPQGPQAPASDAGDYMSWRAQQQRNPFPAKPFAPLGTDPIEGLHHMGGWRLADRQDTSYGRYMQDKHMQDTLRDTGVYTAHPAYYGNR